MGVILSSETFVTMYQSTNKGPNILSQCSVVNVRVLFYLKTVLVVAFFFPSQTSYPADKLLIVLVCESYPDGTVDSISTRTSSVRALMLST
jgi:hypothetical protein